MFKKEKENVSSYRKVLTPSSPIRRLPWTKKDEHGDAIHKKSLMQCA